MNERNSIMTKKLSGVVVLLSIGALLTNGCVYDLLNVSIKLDGKECKTPTGEWDRNQKYVECVSFDGVEAEVVPYCDGIGLVVYAVGKFRNSFMRNTCRLDSSPRLRAIEGGICITTVCLSLHGIWHGQMQYSSVFRPFVGF